MPRPTGEILPGTLEMLILRTLTVDRMHGYAIAQHIGRTSQDALRVEKGSLYPALERLLRNGWATAKWGKTPTGRNARYYTITASGRRALAEELAALTRMSGAIARVVRTN